MNLLGLYSPPLAAGQFILNEWEESKVMTTYNMNTLRVGTKIIMDEYPCVIVGADLVKPGLKMLVSMRLR